MDYDQFQIFKQITLDYFQKLSPNGDQPVMGEPFMLFGDPQVCDFTSLVQIDGELRGCLYLTSPTPVLRNVLELNGENEVSERTLRDMSRELSNVLAGNASHAFGGNWRISVPQTLVPEDFREVDLPSSTFVMPITWRDQQMYLVVALKNREDQTV